LKGENSTSSALSPKIPSEALPQTDEAFAASSPKLGITPFRRTNVQIFACEDCQELLFERGSVLEAMEILRTCCAQGAKEASGVAVIIDVFRAFSCEPLLFHFGARKIILESDPTKATALKRTYPEYLLVGEVNEVPIEGADLGNSPSEIVLKGETYFKDKIVVHRTTAGVTGATAALAKAQEVLLTSFLTARAVAGYIMKKNPLRVTLVAMGERASKPAPEDEACADYLEHLLTGKAYDPVQTLKNILFQPTAQKFIRGTKAYLPREDPVFCLQRNLFDFVLTVRREKEQLLVVKVE
jgi:2-phosphosulfolactate phosphatase